MCTNDTVQREEGSSRFGSGTKNNHNCVREVKKEGGGGRGGGGEGGREGGMT